MIRSIQLIREDSAIPTETVWLLAGSSSEDETIAVLENQRSVTAFSVLPGCLILVSPIKGKGPCRVYQVDPTRQAGDIITNDLKLHGNFRLVCESNGANAVRNTLLIFSNWKQTSGEVSDSEIYLTKFGKFFQQKADAFAVQVKFTER